MNAAKFYWAVVGDANPEPVAVVVEDGRRVAYTCGCPDPFEVDGPDARIQLVHTERTPAGYVRGRKPLQPGQMIADHLTEDDEPEPLVVPMKPSDAAGLRAARELALERDRKRGISHGHRRFNP